MDLINPPGMRAQAASGALFTGAAQIYRVLVNFLSSVFLARLLMPADFGLIAMVSSCVTFVALIQDLGLNQATIQREQISATQVSALFWLSLGVSLILALLLALCAPIIAWFFKEPRLTHLTIGYAVIVALGGAQSQQWALMNRQLRFKSLAAIDIVTATVGAVSGVAVAWLTASYWALFTSNFVSIIAGLTCVWMLCSFRPGAPSFQGDFREIMSFGSGVSGYNIVNYFARNADNLLIGKFYGDVQLGLYDRAYKLLLFPLSQIQTPIGRVVLPLLARLQSDPERYRKAYTECLTLLLVATQPGLIFAIIFAEPIFLVLFGPQWVSAAPIFRWLGIAGLYHAIASPTSWLFLSQGRSRDLFRLGLYNSVTIVGSFGAGLPWGPIGVAAVFTISQYVLVAPVVFLAAGRRGPVTNRQLRAMAAPHVVATMVGIVALLIVAETTPAPGILSCGLLFALSYGVYCFSLAFFPSKRHILIQNYRYFAVRHRERKIGP